MSWLLPSVLAIGAFAALATVALHFIARSRPLAEPLPTARFVPQKPVHARARSVALSDLILLALRIAAIVALTAGAAGPVLSSRGRVSRVILADRSRAIASAAAVRDSVRAYLRSGDQLVIFDSGAVRAQPALDSIVATGARGSLSAALAAAAHLAVYAADHADSIDLVLVSPMSIEEVDDATLKIRNTWPGRVRVVPVAAFPVREGVSRMQVDAPPNDALAAGLSLLPKSSVRADVRIVRTRPSAADSLWARIVGHVLVVWPASPSATSFAARSTVDTIGGVVSNGGVMVSNFPRLWALEGTAVARWTDGEPAAVERPLGDGCERDVGILIDQASDLTLRAPFRLFVSPLLAPCGGMRATQSLPASAITAFTGPTGLAPASAFRDRATIVSRATPWLLALGALLLILELAVRRSNRRLA